MATYTVSAFSVSERVPMKAGTAPFGVASGTITVNPYSQTRLAIAQITGLFKTNGLLNVVAGPLDSSGKYIVSWDAVNKSLSAWTASATQAAEGATDVGSIQWMAIGQLG